MAEIMQPGQLQPLTQEELEKNREMSLKVLENSYVMYENSIKEMEQEATKRTDKNGMRVYTNESLKKNKKLLLAAQSDVVTQYVQLGGDKTKLEELIKDKKKGVLDKKQLKDLMKRETAKDEMAEYIEKMRSKDLKTTVVETPVISASEQETIVTVKEEKEVKVDNESMPAPQQPTVEQKQTTNIIPGAISGKQLYDFVNLPSKGQCYRNKKSRLKVSYLTAYDENMILSPTLYRDGTFLEFLLKNKIMDDDFNVDEMTQGDRDAVILWLRATGYGNDYPIVVTDEESKKEFETSIDLSTLKYKKFNLKGDENGYFSYELPKSKDIIKFKFLSIADLALLKSLKIKESKKNNVLNIRQLCSDLADAVRDNELISFNSQQKIKTAIEVVREEINANYDEETDLSFSHELTDRLLLQTVSINGITDRKYIENYIFNMNVRDAADYRKYIFENEPGVDFNVEVERPQSLGGGSIKSFLRFDQFVFINV